MTVSRSALALVGGLLLCGIPHRPATASTLGDVIYTRQGGTEQIPPAYFPHWVHRIKFKCYACHDDLFPMRRGPNPTMAAMAKGGACGACHNGTLAFGVDTCHRCHIRP